MDHAKADDIVVEDMSQYVDELDPAKERVKAIVTLVVVCFLNILNVLGYSVDVDAWLKVVLTILAGASTVYSWWKNQNVTEEASAAQSILVALKNLKKEERNGLDEAN